MTDQPKNDLLTRVRACVAAIPRYKCHTCSQDLRVPTECGSLSLLDQCRIFPRQDTPAEALLREIAALEPVALIYQNDLSALKHGRSDVPVFTTRVPIGGYVPLYTLTGDSHD